MEKVLEFSKKNTAAMKGIAIIMMLFHHCFLEGRYEEFNIIFSPFSESFVAMLASFLKICVAIFVFLTGYGLAIKYLDENSKGDKSIAKSTASRYLSLMSGFVFIFILSQIVFIISKIACTYLGKEPLTAYTGDTKVTSVMYFIIDGLGLANLFATPTLNGTWWYMSLAIILIAIIPLIIKLYKKYGFLATSVVLILITHGLNIQNQNLVRWLYTAFLGIVCADKNILVKLREFKIIKSNKYINKILKFVIATLILVGLFFVRQKTDYIIYELNDALIPVFVIYYCFEFIMPIKYINDILMYLGKHSMNIFLIHTFIRAHYLNTFTYSFKYPALIVLVLLVFSLILSIKKKKKKKYSGYNKLVEKIREKIS